MKINEFLDKPHRHHALLLVSPQFFEHNGLKDDELLLFARNQCRINVTSLEELRRHPDYFELDRERHQIRLEDVAAIRERILYPPKEATKRLFYLERIDRLGNSAANALLKTFEEPLANVLFLATVPYEHLILRTIVSRFQSVPLALGHTYHQPLEPKDLALIRERLKKPLRGFELVESHWEPMVLENFGIKPSELNTLLKQCEGLTKIYDTKDLINALLFILAENHDSWNSKTAFVKKELSHWMNDLAYHPTPALRLLRILI